MSKHGKVYLVGAGPGDPGLITVRGRQCIEQAEVLIYDYLAAEAFLRYAPAKAERIYVGKKAGQHTLQQEKINQLIVEKAQQGKNVVRLKGGDPFVFGRGGEEALELVEAGIEFEIVPGVTAGIAAPAYAGIPVTHRDYASDFALITGHEDASRTGESQIDWESLGKWKGTLAFYMGVRNLPIICENLQQHGMSSDTPAALIAWGTTPRQRTLTATIATLPDLATQQNFQPPAIILIGQVVKLRDQLSWFEKRPLFGRRIIVTRSRAQASELTEKLTQLGAEVIECPTIRIEPPEDPEPLRRAVQNLPQYDWLILTSVNGVEAFFEQLAAAGYDSRRLGGVKVCAIGPATAAKLGLFRIKADLIPERFVAESILEAFKTRENIENQHILLARADISRKDLPVGLLGMRAKVDEVIAYRTVRDESGKEQAVQAVKADQVDWVTFTSSSTVRNFLEIIGLDKLSGKKLKLVSIGPITSATIQQAALSVDVEAEEYTIPGLVEAILGEEKKVKR
jgi:uroporphyrinogen III methyltransferase / synthase